MQNKMRFIGITGGVGAGKTEVLNFIREEPGVRVLESDRIARELEEPGGACYEAIRNAFPEDALWDADGRMNRARFAETVFSHEEERNKLNRLVHPEVKRYIINEFEKEKREGKNRFLILEAALLIEEQYDEICDELWYVFASEETRRKRLKEQRGYSDEKISSIFRSQLPEKTYRHACTAVIDNDGDREKTREQIRKLLQIG